MNAPDPFVQTVRGPVSPQSLGQTLMHEHLLFDWPRALALVDDTIETCAGIERVLSCLDVCAQLGVGAFVDVGTETFGPTPLFLQSVAARTAVQIVASTGVFGADTAPPPGWAYYPAGVEDVAEHFIDVATEGIAGSGVKPGVIKLGTGARPISELEERVFRGAALAQRTTGLAITTHTQVTAFAEEQVELLADAGADLDRVIIGHVGWGSGPEDLDLHKRLVERGVTIGLDLVGSPARSLEGFAQIALDLIEAGYASQITLSHDGVAISRGLVEVFGEDWLSGDFGIVHRSLLPLLRDAGVDEAAIELMMVDNPRRLLAVDPARYPGAVDTLLRKSSADPLAAFEYAG